MYQFYVSYFITVMSYPFSMALTSALYAGLLGNIPQVRAVLYINLRIHNIYKYYQLSLDLCDKFYQFSRVIFLGILDGNSNNEWKSFEGDRPSRRFLCVSSIWYIFHIRWCLHNLNHRIISRCSVISTTKGNISIRTLRKQTFSIAKF